MLEWVKQNIELVGVTVTLIPVFWGAIQFILIRRSEHKQRQFETYHRLIKDLVQPGDSGNMYFDRQIATLYELQRFKEYKIPTIRILKGLKTKWVGNVEEFPTMSSLILQLDETIAKLQKGSTLAK